MAKLILIRGLPGSGKSTLARALLGAGVVQQHFEADMFFERFRRDEKSGHIYELEDSEEREYVFDGSLIARAHDWCQMMTSQALQRGENVVVSNTFTRRKEMEPYWEMVGELGGGVVFTARGNFGSVHNIPDASMARMKARWEQ